MTKEEFKFKLQKIKNKNIQKEYRMKLKEEKRKLDKPKVETSKLIALYLFFLLNVIIVYAMVVMWDTRDITALGILISDIAAQVLIYAIYCMKAYHGKKQSEQVKLIREYGGDISSVLSAGSKSKAPVPVTVGSVEPELFEE